VATVIKRAIVFSHVTLTTTIPKDSFSFFSSSSCMLAACMTAAPSIDSCPKKILEHLYEKAQ
jgi:hypothetical protein